MAANKDHLRNRVTKIQEDENDNIVKIDETLTEEDGTVFKTSIVPPVNKVKPAGDKTHLLERDNSFDVATEQYDNTQNSNNIFGDWFDRDNYRGLLDALDFSNDEVVSINNDTIDPLISSQIPETNLSDDVPIFDYDSILNPDYKTANAEYPLSDKGMELIANDPGYKNRDEIKAKNDKILAGEEEEILTEEDKTELNNNSTARQMVQEYKSDIDAAGDNENLLSKASEEYNQGVNEINKINPKLAKSLFAAGAAMLMGQSFGDALATGFGVIEEAEQEKIAQDQANSEDVIKMLIDNAAYLTPAILKDTLDKYPSLSKSRRASIEKMFEISGGVQGSINLKANLEALDNKWTGIINPYLKEENKLYAIENLDRLKLYVMNKKGIKNILESPEEADAINATISAWLREAEAGIKEAKGNINGYKAAGSIEAIYEGMHGQVRYDVGGDIVHDIPVPKKYEPHNFILLETLRTEEISSLKNQKEIDEYLAKKEAIFMDSVAGVGPYGKMIKDEEGGVQYPEYVNWLYNQVQRDFGSEIK